jgi:hypothetical protein
MAAWSWLVEMQPGQLIVLSHGAASLNQSDAIAFVETGVEDFIEAFVLLLLQAALVRTVLAGPGADRISFGANLTTMLRASGRLFVIAVPVSLPLTVEMLTLKFAEPWMLFILLFPISFVTICWSLAAPATVIETIPALVSLERSWNLMRGSRWQILGLFVIVGIADAMILFALTRLGTLGSTLIGLVSTTRIVSNVAGALMLLLRATIFDTIYCQLRALKEGRLLTDVAATFE